MAIRRIVFRGLILVLALSAIGANFLAYTRPWFLQWGATPAELTRVLPGDEIVPNAVSQYTRAVTVQAPVEQVWPWLAQLGQDRGGFYSFDLLENIVGCQMPVDDVLRASKQTWQEGDRESRRGRIRDAADLRSRPRHGLCDTRARHDAR